jgi:16S rRNA (adenine1518-N6/adenine1519-N6)-dimethyltransferase
MTGKEAAEICNRCGIIARKRWGQNFLCSEEITDRIIDAAGITNEDSVLEIGPGIGALTEKLIAVAGRVLAVEIDPVLADYLNARFVGSSHCTIIQGDFLDLSIDRITGAIGRPQVIISNLPYNLTTPIITKLMSDYPDASTMLFMVEQDACDRIFSSPSSKSYGPLSVLSSVFGRKEKLFAVSPHLFFPPPHTVSAVIRFSREKNSEPMPRGFVSFVRDATAARRKTLLNALAQSSEFSGQIQKAREFLIRKGLSESIRAEALDPLEFLSLFQELLPNI